MISNESFTKKWVESLRQPKEHKRINPPLLEKMIRALSLIEGLKQEGLDFIFKGGTALVSC